MEVGQQYKGENHMSNFEDVKKFMKTFGQQVVTKPQFPDEKTIKLRFDLIQEELNELQHAIKTKDLKEVADALTDILYVTSVSYTHLRAHET